MPQASDTGPIALGGTTGSGLHGKYRLRISTMLLSPGTISAILSEQRGYRRGYVAGVPIFWLILLAGGIYAGFNVMLLRRQYPPSPMVIAPRREHR